jgi:phytoene dehydrogenase-like protein
MQSCDILIIGAGTNGLAAAGRLAKAGRKVMVVERARQVGGGAVTEEFAPGYRASSVAHLLYVLDERVERELELSRHGLTFAARSLPTTALSEMGEHLVLEGQYGETVRGGLTDRDAAAWATLRRKLLRYAAVLGPFKEIIPPRLGSATPKELLRLGRLGLAIRRLGREDTREFLRLVLINVADLLDDELSDQRLKGLLAFDTVLGTHLGPRSPNSLLLLYYRLAGSAAGKRAAIAIPKGGMGAVAEAMVRAVTGLGGEVRTNTQVSSIVITDDRAQGVKLATGEEIRAGLVVSAIDPRTTFLDLVGPRNLDTGFVRRIRDIRVRGNAAKLHLALTDLPKFNGLDEKALAGRLVIAPSVDAVEAAFNPAKYGEFSPQPVMEIVIPSLVDPTLAPDGNHVLSAIAQYAPYHLNGGWQNGRPRFFDTLLGVLETYAPGIGKLIAAAKLFTPWDLEQHYGFAGGEWHHGELVVERMFSLRPTIGAAQYETPVPGLYLAGAGSHPGGGVSGAAGWNAAGHVLAQDGGR